MKHVRWLTMLTLTLVFVNHAWAEDRCIGPKDNTVAVDTYGVPPIDAADIVWCDDFNSYCYSNAQNLSVWPGYPPTPDNICGTEDINDTQWFQNAVHWPRMITDGRRAEVWPSEWVGWDITTNWKSEPYVVTLPGFTSGDTTVYNSFDMTGAIENRFGEGNDLLFGTDANPLVLRYWMYHHYQHNGRPWSSPHYVEIRMDRGTDHPNDRASTDYVVQDCQTWHFCSCIADNTGGVCDEDMCVGGPYDGLACSVDLDCQIYCDLGQCDGPSCVNWQCPPWTMQCDGGPNAGDPCTSDADCLTTCDTGGPDWPVCTTNADCRECTSGPNLGASCSVNADCSGCVGGGGHGESCTTDIFCQRRCDVEQQAVCEAGPHEGMNCSKGDDCRGGPFLPIVNQQWLSPAAPSPPVDDDQVWRSLAFGMLAHTNTNPCDGEGGKPHDYRPSTFDGNRWWELRPNVKPGSGTFWYSSGQAFFEMKIRTSDYIVRFLAPPSVQADPVWSQATVDRRYLGPFNTISMGTGPGRQWVQDPETGTWSLEGEPDLWRYVEDYPDKAWWRGRFDRPAVLGGAVGASDGACCLPDLTCIETDDADCLDQGGRFRGYDTLCAETLCCHYPFADADGDGDVDQADFGAWQACYTGEGGGILPGYCECFDRNNSGSVEGSDFVEFMNCYTGANVPYADLLLYDCNP